MEINPLGSSATTTGGPASIAQTFDTFLKLLTTQLKYQDPLSPMDTAEFTNQLTQFSQVEQAIKTNAGLDSLLAAQQSNQAMSALGYIGKEVEARSDSIQLAGGTATILYALPKGVASTAVAIMDDKGNVLRRAAGETSPGRHDFVWDGKDDNGVQLPDGPYTIAVSAFDAQGNQIEEVLFGLAGIVDEVISEGGPVFLMVGDVPIKLEDVAAVRNLP